MSTTFSSIEQRRWEKLAGPRRWADANADLLRLIWDKFVTDGDWPQAKALQRELYSGGPHFDANEFSRESPPSIARLDLPSGKLILTPHALEWVPAAQPMLQRMAALVRLAVERYPNTNQDEEPMFISTEFPGLFGLDERQTRQLTEVLLQDTWLFLAAGGSAEEGQQFKVDETAILKVRGVETIEDYFNAEGQDWWSVPRDVEIPNPLIDSEPAQTEPVAPQRPVAVAVADTAGLRDSPQPVLNPVGDAERAKAPAETQALKGLHPLILKACEPHWANDRAVAIERAALALVEAVREQSGMNDLDGSEVMKDAFNPKDPLIVVADPSTLTGRNRQRGTHLMAMGVMAAIRNVASHSQDEPPIDDARDQLATISFVARRLDDARKALWKAEDD